MVAWHYVIDKMITGLNNHRSVCGLDNSTIGLYGGGYCQDTARTGQFDHCHFHHWPFSALATLITGQNDHFHTYGLIFLWILQTQDCANTWPLLDNMNTGLCENALSAAN